MSYTRRFSKTVSISYSGSVSYPPSENGGTKHYSGTAHETIHFDVTVDTEPFDDAIGHMKNGVDLLTGSVVATEAAQLKAIDSASKKIGDTIVSGFFKTVKSDISQQIAQLKIHSESLLLQLNKLAERCREKQKQMGTDYQRISERYVKIFTDLSKELENRIYSIDEPVFRTTRQVDSIGSHEGNEEAAATVSVTAGETARVHSVVAANQAKRRALEAIEKGKRFLAIQYSTDDVIRRCLLPKGDSGLMATPFCVMEGMTGQGQTGRQLFASPLLSGLDENTLNQGIDAKGWSRRMPAEEADHINDYFNSSVAQMHAQAKDAHARRVADMTAHLFNLSQTAVAGK